MSFRGKHGSDHCEYKEGRKKLSFPFGRMYSDDL
jgi:hypothetical protein